MPITLRNTKGSPLTFNEVDNNFLSLQVTVNTEVLTSDREILSTEATIQRLNPIGSDRIVYLPEDSAEDFTNLRFQLNNIGSANNLNVRTKDISTWAQEGNTYTVPSQFDGGVSPFDLLSSNRIVHVQDGPTFGGRWSQEWHTVYEWNGSSFGQYGIQYDAGRNTIPDDVVTIANNRIIFRYYGAYIYVYNWSETTKTFSSGSSSQYLGSGSNHFIAKLTDNYIVNFVESPNEFDVWGFAANTWTNHHTWDSDFSGTDDGRAIDNLIDSDVSRFVFLWDDNSDVFLSTYEYSVASNVITRIGDITTISGDAGNATTNLSQVASLTPTRIVVMDTTNFELLVYDFNGTNWIQAGNGYTVSGFTSIKRIKALDTSKLIIQGSTSEGRVLLRVYEAQPSYALGTVTPGSSKGYIHDGIEWLEISDIIPQTFDTINDQTLTNDISLGDNAKRIQRLNPNGNVRNVDLPNVLDSDYKIQIHNSGSAGTLKVFSPFVDEVWSDEIGNSFTVPGSSNQIVELSSNRFARFYPFDDTLHAYEWNGENWNEIGNSYDFSGGTWYIPASGLIQMVRLQDNRIAMLWDDVINSQAVLLVVDFDGTDWTPGTKYNLAGGPLGWYTNVDRFTAMGSNRIAVYNTGSGSNQDDVVSLYNFDGSNWSHELSYNTSQRNYLRLIGVDSDRFVGLDKVGRSFMVRYDGSSRLYNDGGGVEIGYGPTLTMGNSPLTSNRLFFDNDDNTYSLYEFDGENFYEIEGTTISDSAGTPLILDSKTIAFYKSSTNVISGVYKLQQDSDGLATIYPDGTAEFANTGSGWTKTFSSLGAEGIREATKYIAIDSDDMPFTAVAGAKYAVNTDGSGGGTINLPANPSISTEVTFLDAQSTFDSDPLTIGRNSESIDGADSDATLNTLSSGKGFERKFAFVGGTRGWALIT